MKPSQLFSLSAAFCCILGAALPVAQAQQAPLQTPQIATAGTPLIFNGDFVDEGANWQLQGGRFNGIDAPVASGRALRFELAPPLDAQPWSILFSQPVASRFTSAETVRLRFWARAETPIKIAGMLEQDLAPYDKIVRGEADLTPQWKEFDFSGAAPRDFEENSTRLTFHLGYGAAKIELAGVRLEATNRAAMLQATRQSAPVSLITNGDWSAPFNGTWNSQGEVKTEIVPAQIEGYPQALRVSATVPENVKPWDFQIGQTVKVAVPRESAIYLRAYLRAPQGAETARVGMVYEKASEPFTKIIYQTVKLTPQWQEFRFAGTTTEAMEAGSSQVKFFLGYASGSVEIAGVRAESYGRAPLATFKETVQPVDYWNGAAHDDTWKAAALERIENHRKANFAVRVVDTAGKAVPGAQVKIEMTRHAFRWGVAGKAERLVDLKGADNRRFQSEVKRLYNTFTFENDLKWQEVTPDLSRLRAADMAIGWLRAHDFEIRGHTLVWGNQRFLPAGVLDLPAPELTQTVKERVQNFARRYRGQVYVWDVVNEAADNVALWDKIGWDNFANAYKWAREIDPDVRLSYNDYNISNLAGDSGHRAKVLARVQTLLDAGAPIDIIGDQAHMGAPLTPLPKFLSNLDEVAAVGKPIEITEFDLSVKDDKVHGDYVRDILIAAFSHPKVAGFIQWGMWEGDHWLADKGGAMFRADWSKRPAQIAYEDLVLNQWWTRATGKTGANGSYQTRGFLGNYDVSASAGGKTTTVQAKLAADGQNLTLILP